MVPIFARADPGYFFEFDGKIVRVLKARHPGYLVYFIEWILQQFFGLFDSNVGK